MSDKQEPIKVKRKYKTKSAYEKAWNKYKETKDYKNNIEAMGAKGILLPYCDNILQSTFSAGFHSSPSLKTNYEHR